MNCFIDPSRGFVRTQVCLYEAAGFVNLGPSAVVHGQDKWIDMAFAEE